MGGVVASAGCRDRKCCGGELLRTACFADFGATVQKVEPPQGDPLRRTAPYDARTGRAPGSRFLNFNKSSVALDPNDESALVAR